MDAHLNAFEKTTRSCYSTPDTCFNAIVDTPRTQLTLKEHPVTKGPKSITQYTIRREESPLQKGKKLTPKVSLNALTTLAEIGFYMSQGRLQGLD